MRIRARACIALIASFLAACSTASAAQSWQLWKINADGTGLAKFADTPGYTCGSPDWSPDGKLVAYDTWETSQTLEDSQIAVIGADGKNRRLIGPGAMPSWSPDGKQLVCHTYKPYTIVVMNADGAGREKILDHWGSPRWSPKGNRIATILNNNIALYDLATGKERTILPDRYDVHYGFAISPDGEQFCFGGTQGGVFLATLDEKTMAASVRHLLMTGMCRHASFSPDGKRVVFSWQPDKKPGQLYVLNLAGEHGPELLKGQNNSRSNFNPDWSPDGKTIIFATAVATVDNE
jgi:TolB protein